VSEYEFATLDASHDVSNFVSGEDSIDNWLKRQALTQQATGSARTFVLLEPGSPQVWGYYALTVASVERDQVTKAARSGLPQSFPIPAVLLARMGRDEKRRGQGYGPILVADAVLRTLTIAKEAGVRLLIVHALNEKAKEFYLGLDFQPSPIDERLLMLSVQDLAATYVDSR
jgi:GNAT superfamily N-acetyltransferase